MLVLSCMCCVVYPLCSHHNWKKAGLSALSFSESGWEDMLVSVVDSILPILVNHYLTGIDQVKYKLQSSSPDLNRAAYDVLILR